VAAGSRLAARELELRARGIRVLVVDVDGVLTDGRIVLDTQGRAARTFHESDRTGVRLLVRAGLAVVALEARRPRTQPAYARLLSLTAVLEGAGEGLASVRRFCRRRRLTLEQVAYVGHDVPDLPLLAAAGLAIVVANASEAVRRSAHWVTTSRGGEGVAREVGERILRAQGKWASTVGETWRGWE
jgi:3-deoxy-D-manno-octulosonate 8-phosphate phosphatase (KDO 8-P phosphatase)